MRYSIVPAAILAALAISAPASAAPGEIDVRYNDLNLSSAEGQRTLDNRIKRAARSVCKYESTRTGTRIPDREAVACYKKAVNSAKKQMAQIIQDKQLGG